jgi:ribose transport system permease protein
MTDRQRNLRLLIPVYVIFLLIYGVACILEPTFFTWGNNVNLFTRIVPLVLVGIAQTYVVLTGGIDLSIGAIIGLTNAVAVSLPFVNSPTNVVLWLIIPPLVGMMIGMINGLIITKGGFPPLIVTLATSQIIGGIGLFILSVPGGKITKGLPRAVTGKLFHIVPVPLILLFAFIGIFYVILKYTSFGRSIYAVGGNETVALESGIKPNRVKIWVYGVSGLLSGFAGIYLSTVMNSGDPLVGTPYTLNSIAVAVIGGTSLMGGVGGVLGILGAAYIYQLLNNILNLLAVSTFYQFVVKGLVLIIALAITSSGSGNRLRDIFARNYSRRNLHHE